MTLAATTSPVTEALLTEYANWMRSWNASDKTIGARVTLARTRLAAWGLDGFTPENVSHFLSDAAFGKWTRSTYYGHLNDFGGWLVATGRLDANPVDTVRSPQRPRSKPRPLSEEEVAKVLSVAEGATRHWILFAMLAGLRASEIATLRGEDIDENGIYVLGKGETKVTLPCHADLWEIAQTYPREGYLWPGSDHGHIPGQQVSMGVGRLFRGMGIDGSVHRCRHVYGTRLLRGGANIRVVQKLMRHASLATTAMYTAVDEDEMRDAVNRLRAG